jgi:nudix-type nucleoside diphosphatase (YffH/AdpP family)
MPRKVEIISEKRVFDHHFKIDEAHLRYQLFNGEMSPELTRLNFERGDSAAVILHDPMLDTLIMTEQFRYPTYAKDKDHAWILEIPAGSIEENENADPTITLRRELMEEIGYSVKNFRKVASFFVSPGGTSERIHLFYAAVKPKDKIAMGGGLVSEGEDVRMVSMGVKEALYKITTGDIMDAKTIIGLQWLQINRATLPPVPGG